MIRVLLLSSFAGSSRYIASLLPLLKKSASVFLVAEGVGADIFCKDSVNVDCVVEADKKSISDVFDQFSPDVIFVVPQFGGSIEELAIEEAKKRGIYCIAGIDHWSLYKERFSRTDSDGNILDDGFEFIPDKILVNDEIAYRDAIDAGIPDSCLSIVGNPVLESRWKGSLAEFSSAQLGNKNQSNKKIILFISEPYSERVSIKNKHYPGFSEIDVLEDILSSMPNNSELWIKSHPAETIEKFTPYIKQNDNCKLCINEAIDNVLLGADKIIGMGSMLLLEVALIREAVISYRPSEQQTFIGNRLGVTEKIINKKNLPKTLRSDSPFRKKPFDHNYSGATEKIIACIMSF